MPYNELPNGFTGMPRRNAANDARDASLHRGAYAAEQQGFIAAPSGSFQYARDFRSAAESGDFDYQKLGMTPDLDRRWAWVEVDLSAIRHNVTQVKRRLKSGCRLMAIVKADAYGHGAVQCAKAALASGADYLGVATVDEAIELRAASISAPIMILAQPPIASIPLLLAYRILPSIYETEFAVAYGEEADRHNMVAPYHLAVNTGMNRIGVRYDEVVDFLRQIAFHRALELDGTFTHFATSDCDDPLDFDIQAKRFIECICAMHDVGINPGIIHCCNSAAIIRYPAVHFDMVRLGISLYGFHPCRQTLGVIDLQPAMSVHARITDTRIVPMSEGVSYGLHYRSKGSAMICTVPLGYADGLRRGLSGRTDFILGGRLHRQVGNICMDQCMFEVDMRSSGLYARIEPQVGDEVLIVGRQGDAQVTIDQMASTLDTIQHEISIGFSQRMPRLYT